MVKRGEHRIIVGAGASRRPSAARVLERTELATIRAIGIW
jgi:hypothetical protein